MDLLVYPVSLVMRFWHSVLSLVVSPDSGIAWVGAVVLLVVTVRLLLMRSMWRQMYSMRKMSQLAPQMQKLQKEHKEDKQKLAEETQKLWSEAKVNPLQGCLPIFVQIPVFLGLYWTLINFTPRDKSLDEAMTMSNGAFGPDQVASFLRAEMFGVPLSAYLRMPQDVIETLHPGLGRETIYAVIVPLFVLAGIATFVNMRNSFKRQEAAKKAQEEAAERAELEERAGGPVVDGEVVSGEPGDPVVIDGEVVADGEDPDEIKAGGGSDAVATTGDAEEEKKDDSPELPPFAEAMQESMNQTMKTLMYVFPVFPIAGAFLLNFPVAIGLYWFTNNIWTLVQTHFFMEKLEKELPHTGREGLPPSAFM